MELLEREDNNIFQITIDDVFVIKSNVAISGKCLNKNEFTSKLVDEDGTEYLANIPFIKHVVTPAYDYITIEIKNISDTKALIGRTLRSVS